MLAAFLGSGFPFMGSRLGEFHHIGDLAHEFHLKVFVQVADFDDLD